MRARESGIFEEQSGKNIPSEPGTILNTLSSALGQAIWLLSKDFQVVWYSDHSYHLAGDIGGFRGHAAERSMPGILSEIRKIADKDHLAVSKGCYRGKGECWELTVVPISEQDQPLGYIVTIDKTKESALVGLLEKQKKREERYAKS